MDYRDLLYFRGPLTIEEVTHQRDVLAAAIAEAAHKLGIYNAEVGVSTPQLLMFLQDMVPTKQTQEMTYTPGVFGDFEPFELCEGFHLLPANLQGIWVDGGWKKKMAERHPQFVVADQGLDYDGIFVGPNNEATYCDVKLLRKIKTTSYKCTANVYLSHNEYQFAKINNTVIEIVGAENGKIKHLTEFTFREAKEAGAITLFPEGKTSLGRESKKQEIPWCIDVLTVRPDLESRLITVFGH